MMDNSAIYDQERIREENLMEPLYRHESDGSYSPLFYHDEFLSMP